MSRTRPAPGPDLDISPGTGPDRADAGAIAQFVGVMSDREWTARVGAAICAALGLAPEKARVQVKSIKATIRKFRDRPNRDRVAVEVIEAAREKRDDPDVDSAVRVWQAAMNRRFGPTRRGQ